MGRELDIEEQKTKLNLMKHILLGISGYTKYTYGMKGGSALRIFYGLNRFSEDIDLHGKVPIDLIKIILKQSKEFGLSDSEVISKKMTDTVNRYMLHYRKNDNEDTLKIECSFRGEWNQDNVSIIDNCSVMNIQFLIKGKIDALIHREMPRDVYDINFLLNNYKSSFDKDDLINVYNHINNRGMNQILFQMQHTIKTNDDWILKNVDCEETVLNLYQTMNDYFIQDNQTEKAKKIQNRKKHHLKPH